MSNNIQSIRGMHDFAPAEAQTMRLLEAKLIAVLNSYAYQEVRTPIVEKLDLFKRSIGEVTDIVEKEMYAFEDRGGDCLALRPEGTASVVRAGIQNGWLHNQQQRYWYLGPYFRRERPQKGRYRQFHQLGVETFGLTGPDIDLELILIPQRFWQALGLQSLQLQLNSLGDAEARSKHRQDLVAYLNDHQAMLDDDARKRMHSNPLRVLDSKNPQVQEVTAQAPVLLDYLGSEEQEHFAALQEGLDTMQISYQINPRLVRGLDYYNRTVFEWVSAELGAQGTVCAGGRYDNLVAQLGGRATPAAGFAVGLERLHSLAEGMLHTDAKGIDAYFIALGNNAHRHAMQLVEQIRSKLPNLAIQLNCGGGSIKSQMKRADRSGARLALIVGEDEIEQRQVAIKYLHSDQPQQTVSQDAVVELLENESKE